MATGSSISGTIGRFEAIIAPDAGLLRARERAALMPDLLVQAQRIAANVTMGWHGRRKRGPGNEFWQYRPYTDGESQTQIDWRRSAREDQNFIRDREWEAAHTLWLWADSGAGMQFQSQLGETSKQSRALVLALALAELASRSGERIAWPNLLSPIAARNGAERLAARLSQSDAIKPDWSAVKQRSDAVFISDFLKPVESIVAELSPLLARGVRGHLVMVLDPAEEIFPYQGQTEFTDPISGASHNVGRAEHLQADYIALLAAHREALLRWCQRCGWSFTLHHTDQKATHCLSKLYQHLEMVAA